MAKKPSSTAKKKPARASAELRARLDAAHGPPSDQPVTTVKDTAGAGRPRTAVDERVLAGLAAIQCTYLEMAAVLSVDESTLRAHYKGLIEKEREAGKMSLRRAQFQSAFKGNTTMQIWLGKQYLGQKDKHEVENREGIPMLVVRRDDIDAPLSEGVAAALDGTLEHAL